MRDCICMSINTSAMFCACADFRQTPIDGEANIQLPQGPVNDVEIKRQITSNTMRRGGGGKCLWVIAQDSGYLPEPFCYCRLKFPYTLSDSRWSQASIDTLVKQAIVGKWLLHLQTMSFSSVDLQANLRKSTRKIKAISCLCQTCSKSWLVVGAILKQQGYSGVETNQDATANKSTHLWKECTTVHEFINVQACMHSIL